MRNALLVISPLEIALLTPAACAGLARTLKHCGVTSADLTTFPRFAYASGGQSHKGWAAPDFNTIARMLVHTVLSPILGHAALQELAFPARISPTLPSLSTVGALFAHAATPRNPDMDRMDGNDLGLVLYLAVHGRDHAGRPYDAMLFPSLSARAQKALRGFLATAAQPLDGYGPLIDLQDLRRFIRRSCQTSPADTPPQNRLN